MLVNKTWLLIGIFTALILGFILGVYFQDVQDAGQPLDLNPLAKSCQYGGKAYRSGEGFPSDDGCNSCSCQDGQVACTLMACD